MSEAGVLKDKVVIVTGAGRNIGRGIALLAAQEGAKVLVNDVGSSVNGVGTDDSPANDVVREIRDAGGAAVASFDDITAWDSAQAVVQKAIDAFGRVDVVVNNAGILRDRIFHQMTPEEFDAVMKVHLYGAFYVSRAAATHFRKQESGAFVHMTSSSGLIGAFGQANYAAAKLGIVGLSKTIALDMAKFNVRSNCVSPSAFTRMIEAIPGRATPAVDKPVSRPEQIAPLAVYLASDAARSINGQIIAARGNEIMLYSQSRPVRSLHRADGWTPARLDLMSKAWKTAFTPLERNGDVLCWEVM